MHSSIKQKLAVSLVLVLLLASIVGNVVLFQALKESFVKIQFARIFPLGHVPVEHLGANGSEQVTSISFWGDSRAYMWDKSAPGSQMAVHDYAHGGITSSQLLLQLATQSSLKTDYAVVQIGINDLHPLGAFADDKARILAQLRSNLPKIREALLARSQVVILTTLFPPGAVPLSRRHAWDPATLKYIDEINEVIRQSSDGSRVILLDSHALLKDSGPYLAAEYVDSDFFLHVNRKAYERLNAELRKIVQRHEPHGRK